LVVAGSQVLEHLLANGNGSFNFFFIDFEVIELEIHDVEIVAAVYRPHYWDSSNEVMGELMTVALDYAVYRSRWEGIDQPTDLIGIGTLPRLFSLLIPNPISSIGVAVISHVAQD
jgi:hypothetical protein